MKSRRFFACFTPLFCMLTAPYAHAADGTWTNTATGGLWSDIANWNSGSGPIADGSGFTADFSTLNITADNTVHLDGPRTLTSLNFGDTVTGTAANWILDNNGNSANILTLAGATPTITVNALGTAKTATISAKIAGTAGLTKAGAGTLVLSGTNTYSGGTTISNSGDTTGIIVANASALGSDAVLVKGGQNFAGSLEVNTGLTVANDLTLKRGNGGSNRAILKLGSGSSWSGAITVDNTSGSGLAVVMGNGTNAATASIVSGDIGFSTLGSGVSLALRSSFGKVSGSISLSTGNLQLLDASKWEFSNASNTWGTLDIANASAIVTVGTANTLSASGVVTSTSAGTLQLNNQAGTTAYSQKIAGLSGNVKVGLTIGAATLTLDTAADQSSSGVISNAISLVKSGTATQTLFGANTYTGTTTVSVGTLKFAQEVSLYNNVTASWTAANLTVASGATAAFNVGGTGEFTVGDIDTIKGLTNVSSGVTATQGFKNGAILGLDTSSGNFTYTTAITDHVAGATTDTLGLTKLGANTLTLSGANTYTGLTTINGGTLAVTNTGAIAGNIVINTGTLSTAGAINGNILINNGGTLTTVSNSIGNTSSITIAAGGIFAQVITDVVGDVSVTGNATGKFNPGSGSSLSMTSLSLTNTIADNSYSLAANSASSTMTVGTGGLTMDGATYWVGQNSNNVARTAKMVLNGNFTGNNTNLLSNNTQITSQLDLGGAIREFDIQSGTTTIATTTGAGSTLVIQNGGIKKIGSGTLVLNGANTYTGTTTVEAGTLALGASGTISSSLTLGTSAGGTGILDVTAKTSFTQADLSGNGTVNIGAGNTLKVSTTLEPGFSPGTLNITGDLTILGTATTTMELADSLGTIGVSSDFVGVTGLLTLGGDLKITSYSGYDLTQSSSYNLFDAANFTGDFSSVTVGSNTLTKSAELWSGTFSGASYQFSQTTGMLTVIPEPSSALLGGISLLALLRRRRKISAAGDSQSTR